jgi:two-component system sensor histidine kinase/response regulator
MAKIATIDSTKWPADWNIMHDERHNDFVNLPLRNIDLHHALQKGGGKEQNLLKIVRMFVQHHSQDLSALERAREEKDYQAAGKLIHTLAGIASFVGALELESKTQAYNHAIHSEEQDKLEALLDAVLSSLPLVLTDLQTVLASQDSAAG